MSQKMTLTIFFLNLVILPIMTSLAFSTTVDEITQELACACGCNMVVSACEGAMECSASNQIKAEVMKSLKQGQSKEEIIRSFVSLYGEKILSAPTKKGFNLTAWALPFLAIVLGGLVLFHTLKKWLSKDGELEKREEAEKPVERRYLEMVKEELRKFDY